MLPLRVSHIHFVGDFTAHVHGCIFHCVGGLLDRTSGAALAWQHHSGHSACSDADAHRNGKSGQLHIPHSLRH